MTLASAWEWYRYGMTSWPSTSSMYSREVFWSDILKWLQHSNLYMCADMLQKIDSSTAWSSDVFTINIPTTKILRPSTLIGLYKSFKPRLQRLRYSHLPPYHITVSIPPDEIAVRCTTPNPGQTFGISEGGGMSRSWTRSMDHDEVQILWPHVLHTPKYLPIIYNFTRLAMRAVNQLLGTWGEEEYGERHTCMQRACIHALRKRHSSKIFRSHL